MPRRKNVKYLSIPQVAVALAVDQKTVRRMIATGELRGVIDVNPDPDRKRRTLRIPEDALDQFLVRRGE
jgi:excisionase family DNA binding protein